MGLSESISIQPKRILPIYQTQQTPGHTKEQPAMELSSSQQGDVTVVKITGSVDALTAGEATTFLETQVKQGHLKLVTDLSDVEYMSSAGLRTLLTTLKQVRQSEGDLRIAGAQENVKKVLEMAGLTSIMKSFDDIKTAVGSFAG